MLENYYEHGWLILLCKIFANIFLIQSFIPKDYIYFSCNATAWYLCDTLYFYFFTPITLRFIRKISFKKKICMFALIYMGQIVVSCSLIASEYAHAIVYISPFFRIFEFIQGCLLGAIFVKYSSKDNAKKINHSMVEIMSIVLVFVTFLIKKRIPIELTYCVLNIPFTGILLYTLSYEKGVVSKVLKTPILMYIGKISFEIFLIHRIVIQMLEKVSAKIIHLSPEFIVIGTCCITFFLSQYTYTRLAAKKNK